MNQLAERVDTIPNYGRCPADDGFLQGDLGIRETVMLAFTAPNANQGARLSRAQNEFGGHVSFILTRNLNSVGPTWQLTRFRGPGNMGSLSRSDTNKITFGFASTRGATQSGALEPTVRARDVLEQLLIGQIASAAGR